MTLAHRGTGGQAARGTQMWPDVAPRHVWYDGGSAWRPDRREAARIVAARSMMSQPHVG